MKIKWNKDDKTLCRDNMDLLDVGLFRKYEVVKDELDYVERTKNCMTVCNGGKKS